MIHSYDIIILYHADNTRGKYRNIKVLLYSLGIDEIVIYRCFEMSQGNNLGSNKRSGKKITKIKTI